MFACRFQFDPFAIPDSGRDEVAILSMNVPSEIETEMKASGTPSFP